MLKSILLGFVLFFCYSAYIYAQNLTAGNPQLNFAEKSVLAEKEITFSLTFFHSYSNKYFNEDHVFSNLKLIKNAFSNYTEFKSSYGFSSKLSASIELGYFFNKTISYQDSSHNGHGLGDAAVYLRYRLIYSKNAKFTLLPTIGIKLPIGVFDQKIGNHNLPIEVQPASGNFKYIAALYMSKVLNEKLSIASICSYEYAQLIDSENFYYKYGDHWMLSFYANYKFLNKFSTDLQISFETKDKSHTTIDKIIESSGYKIIFISPQINYSFNDNWQISTYADLPVYRYYNGIQFSSSFSVSVKLCKKINFQY